MRMRLSRSIENLPCPAPRKADHVGLKNLEARIDLQSRVDAGRHG